MFRPTRRTRGWDNYREPIDNFFMNTNKRLNIQVDISPNNIGLSSDCSLLQSQYTSANNKTQKVTMRFNESSYQYWHKYFTPSLFSSVRSRTDLTNIEKGIIKHVLSLSINIDINQVRFESDAPTDILVYLRLPSDICIDIERYSNSDDTDHQSLCLMKIESKFYYIDNNNRKSVVMKSHMIDDNNIVGIDRKDQDSSKTYYLKFTSYKEHYGGVKKDSIMVLQYDMIKNPQFDDLDDRTPYNYLDSSIDHSKSRDNSMRVYKHIKTMVREFCVFDYHPLDVDTKTIADLSKKNEVCMSIRDIKTSIVDVYMNRVSINIYNYYPTCYVVGDVKKENDGYVLRDYSGSLCVHVNNNINHLIDSVYEVIITINLKDKTVKFEIEQLINIDEQADILTKWCNENNIDISNR